MDLTTPALIIAFSCGVFCVWRLAVWRADRARLHEMWASRFFDASKPLIADDETPIEILKLLLGFNAVLTRGVFVRHLVMALAKARKRARNFRVEDDPIREFLNRRPELAKPFFSAMASAIMAMSYRSPFYGWMLRHFILFDAERHPDRANDLRPLFGDLMPAIGSDCLKAA